MIQYGESKVEIEKTKICLHFIIAYDILIVLVIANSVISTITISYTAMADSAIGILYIVMVDSAIGISYTVMADSATGILYTAIADSTIVYYIQ